MKYIIAVLSSLILFSCNFATPYQTSKTIKFTPKTLAYVVHGLLVVYDENGDWLMQYDSGPTQTGSFDLLLETGFTYKFVWEEYLDEASYSVYHPWMTAEVTQFVDEETYSVDLYPVRLQPDDIWLTTNNVFYLGLQTYVDPNHNDINIKYFDKEGGEGTTVIGTALSSTITLPDDGIAGVPSSDVWWTMTDDLDTSATKTTYYIYDVSITGA